MTPKEIYSSVRDTYDESFRFPTNGFEGADFINTDGYQIWLAHYVKLYRPKKVLEMGRRFGNSLYALAYFLDDSSILTSYDITEGGNVVTKPNVNILVYNGDYTSIDMESYNFIFVDINGGGVEELKYHNYLLDKEYKGVVVWDDIDSVWCPKEEFWDKVESNKGAFDLHGIGTTGIIVYQ